jgi:hypothetical protein
LLFAEKFGERRFISFVILDHDNAVKKLNSADKRLKGRKKRKNAKKVELKGNIFCDRPQVTDVFYSSFYLLLRYMVERGTVVKKMTIKTEIYYRSRNENIKRTSISIVVW